MRNYGRMIGIILSLICILTISPAFSETSEDFFFRNGITFGMNKEQIIQTESDNNQVKQDEWNLSSLDSWKVLIAEEKVQVSKYSAQLGYFMTDNQMELIAYDFQEDVTDTMYKDISAALTVLYGDSQSVPEEEFIQFMKWWYPDCPWTEEDIHSCLTWETEHVMIFQYYYSPDSFGIMYANPKWDYTPAATVPPVSIDTTGL